MSTDLVLSTSWHDRGQRKLEAVRACQTRDVKTLLDLLDTYLSYRGRRGVHTSPNTRHLYGVALRDWLHYCWPEPQSSPDVSLLRASRDDVERYVARLQQRGGHLEDASAEGLRPGSTSAYLAGVRAFYRALQWADAVTTSPAQDVLGPSDPRPRHERRPAMPLADYKRLILELEQGDYDEALRSRNLLLLRLLGDQGLRVSEVVHLETSDIDLAARVMFISNGKGGKTRTVPMTKATFRVLSGWLQKRSVCASSGERTLLVNVGKNVKAARQGRAMHPNTVRLQLETLYKKLGIGPRYRGAHTLRHTAGTRLYRNTRDLYRVAQVLGHQDVNTSSIYAKMDIEGLKEAMATLDDDEV